MPLSILLFLAAQQVEPPRGVNDSVLGTAEEFKSPGPARVCLERTSIDIVEGETAYLDYLGIHWGSIRVIARGRTYLVREGDAWAEPRSNLSLVPDRRGRHIVRQRSPEGPRYLIYSGSKYSRAGGAPVVWLEGDALTGTARDQAILRRIDVDAADMTSCTRRFGYGWDLLGDAEDE